MKKPTQTDSNAAGASDVTELREGDETGVELVGIEVPADGTVVELAAGDAVPGMPTEMLPHDDRPTPTPSETPVAPDAPQAKATQLRWRGVLLVEDQLTDDGRYIAPGATTWRELPLSLLAQLETDDGHDGAVVCGRIDNIWREGNLVMGEGIFDDGDFGQEIARMVSERVLRGNSVDLAVREFELAYRDEFDEDGHRVERPAPEDGAEEPDLLDVLFGEGMVMVFTDAIIGASTLCAFPAFADASVALVGSGVARWRWDAPQQFVVTRVSLDAAPSEVAGDEVVVGAELIDAEPVTASAVETETVEVASPLPAEWFANPDLPELTPLTVTDDGRVFGHVAVWDVCHIGIPDVCTTAPHSSTEYAYFLLGELEVDSGDRVAVGRITLGTGHAEKHLGRAAATAHYDDTGSAVADVAAGEDEFGIWVSGALRAGVSAERVRELRASPISGDWRNVGGNLELVALLAVNVPGFPVPRVRALVAAGEEGARVLTLVSAGVNDARVRFAFSDDDLARLSALRTVAHGGLAALSDRANAAA